MAKQGFSIYQRAAEADEGERRRRLTERQIPANLSNHRAAAAHYQASPALEAAINTALAVGAPLLITGEPGTGKTQVAFHLAWYFGLDAEKDLFTLYIRSSTASKDLLYEFDAVRYFHAANDPRRQSEELDRAEFVNRGPLWEAYEHDGPSIVLLDEIDKAPRDFPNDLLNVLEQNEFRVSETQTTVRRQGTPPIIIITSNSERRLPEPFLRRCIFHHIEFTQELVRRAVKARRHDFPDLSDEVQKVAIDRFLELRGTRARKKPATAELLVWLTVLNARGDIKAKDLAQTPLAKLPALSALIKDRDDLAQL